MHKTFSAHHRHIHSHSASLEPTVDGRLSEVIKVACQALIREADTQSTRLRDSHTPHVAEYRLAANQHSPIHRLPLEILSAILAFAVDSHGGKIWRSVRRTECLDLLASVSKHWRHVVVSTPQLWIRVEEGSCGTELRRIKNHSGSALLDVQFRTGVLSLLCGRSDLVSPFSSFVSENRHRLRTLKASTDRVTPEFLENLLKAPWLQDLTLTGDKQQHHFELRSGEKPIRRPSLEKSSVPWNSARLETLVSLSLTAFEARTHPLFRESFRSWSLLHSKSLNLTMSNCNWDQRLRRLET